MQQQNQTTMTEPPTMISTKDLMYLTDMMSWNLNVVKKAHYLTEDCQLPEMKQAVEEIEKMHQDHYQKLLNFAKSQMTQPNGGGGN